jgi:fructose-specific PTS system IIA-like component
MPKDFSFTCPLPSGLHARPASHLADEAKKFSSNCTLTNLRNSTVADMKSVLSLIAADVRLNDKCSVQVRGADEEAASAALHSFIQHDLPAHDAPLPDVSKDSCMGQLPRALRSAQVHAKFGETASRGIGQGKALIINTVELMPEQLTEKPGEPVIEEQRIRDAFARVRDRMRSKSREHLSQTEAGILAAHLAMLDDAAFTARMLENVANGKSAAQAVMEAGRFFGDLLNRSENPVLRERAIDIHGLCLELVETISGKRTAEPINMEEPSIVIAENLLPQQLLATDRNLLRGLVLEAAGATSHTVILARSLGIPTLLGVLDLIPRPQRRQRDPVDTGDLPLTPGTPLILDANRGFLIINPGDVIQKFYARELKTQERRKSVLACAAATTHAGEKPAMRIATNIASVAESEAAFAGGADGVGVFRTEMLFLSRAEALSENEQFEIYAQAVRAAGDKPVVIRTLDIGGDKPLPFLKIPSEENPFLGYRGLRIYPEHRDLLQTQLRAIFRASVLGHIELLVPMVSTVEEILWFKQQVAEAQKNLEAQQIPLGIMVEVPSAVFLLDQLCPEVNFLSIGTNDLSQYFFAADRGNSHVAGLANARHPAFLRLLEQIVSAARKYKKPVTVCGDMAADPANLPLLLGLGLDEISIPVAEIASIRERTARLSIPDCQRLLSQALAFRTAEDVERLLDREPITDQSLFDRELVLIRDQVENKEAAIREMVDALYIAGRTDDPDRLEDALWAREGAYSTGMGHGFAVPHCKTDAISAGSIAVLKLNEPVEWGPVDGAPVQIVILLAARESDSGTKHLKVFSRLARNLMDEDFRERLLAAENEDAVLNILDSISQQ